MSHRPGRTALIAAATACAALLLAAPASAWYVKLDSFFGSSNGATAKQIVEVRKCKGGREGTYDLQATVIAKGGEDEIFHRVTGKLSVRGKWKPLRDVDLILDVPKDFDPNITQQILTAFGAFYDTIETRFKKGDLQVRHGELVVFGQQILTEGTYAQDFKPKDKCPKFA